MIKKRYWFLVLYPESLPFNYIEILEQTMLPFCISPLHDKDQNEDGTYKKAHYHCIICFNGPTTQNTVKKITDSLNAPLPQWLDSVKGGFEYLTHKNNPEKAQYCEDDIQCFNGFDPSNYYELSKMDILKSKRLVIKIIETNNILFFTELVDLVIDLPDRRLFDTVCSNAYFYDKYISCRRIRREVGYSTERGDLK